MKDSAGRVAKNIILYLLDIWIERERKRMIDREREGEEERERGKEREKEREIERERRRKHLSKVHAIDINTTKLMNMCAGKFERDVCERE